MNKKTVFKIILIIILPAVLLTFPGCPEAPSIQDETGGDEGGTTEPENDFTLISGSGYITLSISGLMSGESMAEHMLMYGASGIPSGQYERIGNAITIDADTETLVLTDGEEPFLFIGGTEVARLGCIIDANNSGEADDGDYIGGVYNKTISGNETINLAFPDDFTLISGSGTILLSLSGLDSFTGLTVMYGATGIPSGNYERVGNGNTIETGEFELTLNDGETDIVFVGGDIIPHAGCIIDANGSGEADDGDYIGGEDDLLINSGAMVSLSYPEDFTMISGSGTITMNISGLTPQTGHSMMYGAAGIPSGQFERIGDSAEITTDTMSLVMKNESVNFMFLGGDTIPMLGSIIDTNDSGYADDGDYIGGVYDTVMNGNMAFELHYNP